MSWETFANNRDRVTSRTGGWTPDGKVSLHGFDLHRELVPNATWMQALALSITGRYYPANEARLMEAMLVVTGYPDPRLWCNRIAALGGSMRVPTTAAMSAAMASAEAKLYGWQATYHAALLINKVKLLFDNESLDQVSNFVRDQINVNRALPGFGRPLTGIEERIAPLDELCNTLSIASGPHLAAARRLEGMLKNRHMFLNYGGYVAVRLLDLGFSPVEVYRISIIGFYIGMMPCYIEAFENEPGTFLPIACEDLLYEGREERPLPE